MRTKEVVSKIAGFHRFGKLHRTIKKRHDDGMCPPRRVGRPGKYDKRWLITLDGNKCETTKYALSKGFHVTIVECNEQTFLDQTIVIKRYGLTVDHVYGDIFDFLKTIGPNIKFNLYLDLFVSKIMPEQLQIVRDMWAKKRINVLGITLSGRCRDGGKYYDRLEHISNTLNADPVYVETYIGDKKSPMIHMRWDKTSTKKSESILFRGKGRIRPNCNLRDIWLILATKPETMSQYIKCWKPKDIDILFGQKCE